MHLVELNELILCKVEKEQGFLFYLWGLGDLGDERRILGSQICFQITIPLCHIQIYINLFKYIPF